MDLQLERIAAVASVPAELLDYQQWLAQHRAAPGTRDYLFSQERVRFEPRSGDVVVCLPGLRLQERGRAVRLLSAQPPLELELTGLSRRDAERILASIDAQRCLAEVLWDSGVEQERLGRFLRAAFGIVVFAPHAVEPLEQRLSGLQLVRFPCPPYAIDRAYWQNMCEVRERILQNASALLDPGTFLTALRELHVIALMGRALDSFYKPASPSSDVLVSPGSLFVSEPHLLPRSGHAIFLDGPRVNATLLGAPGWFEAICAGLDEAHAASERLEHQVEGLPWGRVLMARAEKDDRPRTWFLPPRPMVPGHFERLHAELRRAFRASEQGDADTTIDACALLHQSFVRLHPFQCANQSVAMNLVNWLLARALGSGIPHLLLDLFALRLSPEAYARLFRRAVRGWSLREQQPSRRLALLMERKARSHQLIENLALCASAAERQALIAREPDAARWALLAD